MRGFPYVIATNIGATATVAPAGMPPRRSLWSHRLALGTARSNNHSRHLLRHRRVSKDAETAARQKGLSPNLNIGMPALTTEQEKDVDAYHTYLSMHIRTEPLKAAIRTHRRWTAIGQGSTAMQVSLTISPAGRLTAKGIKMSSGDPALDAIVLAAVECAQPYAPHPKSSHPYRSPGTSASPDRHATKRI